MAADEDADEDDEVRDPGDDRPPICPACGVTMGLALDDRGQVRPVCLECGFPDDG